MNDKASCRLEELNSAAFHLCQHLIENHAEFDIQISRVGGAAILDFGTQRQGARQSGIELANICLGGLADVELRPSTILPDCDSVHVKTKHPLEACMGAQYAGWPLSHEKYFAMCSGPIRLLRGKEPVLSQYNLKVEGGKAVGVLETSQLPSSAIVKMVADECEMDPSDLVLCVASTASYPGSLQIVARSIETALHKLHELEFDLTTIVEAKGQSPWPTGGSDDMIALGRTNDSILYGGIVHLQTDTTDEAIENILDRLPSCSSPEFGTPFLEIFQRYDHDFYKIDKMLFSPARITITNNRTGRVFETGKTRPDVLRKSFGME